MSIVPKVIVVYIIICLSSFLNFDNNDNNITIYNIEVWFIDKIQCLGSHDH